MIIAKSILGRLGNQMFQYAYCKAIKETVGGSLAFSFDKHISSSCGFDAKGGAKSVGIATNKAVVWSFIGIVVIDYIFALLFYF